MPSEPTQPERTTGEGDLVIGGTAVIPASMLSFTFTRSSGPGGQHVNKTSTRAVLRLDLEELVERGVLSAAARTRLARLASHLVTAEGELIIAADESRSQRRNREACLERLRELVLAALVPPRPRKKTRPSAAMKKRRVEAKRRHGEVKARRRKPPPEH